MYKMVISEFDRVLINSDEAISQKNIISIDGVRKRGVLFCIMTDRGLDDIISYNRDFPFIDYIILYNGAVIYDVSSNKEIYLKSIPKGIINKIISKLSSYKILAFYKDRVDNLNMTSDIYQLQIDCKNSRDVKSVCKILDNLDLNISTFIRKDNGKYYILINSKTRAKNLSIRRLARECKIKLGDIIYIGREMEDEEIFKNVGLAVTDGSSDNRLIKCADDVFYSLEYDGIEKLLDKNFK